MEAIDSVVLYAFLGEDEFGSGKIGLKQALTPSGIIPLVAIEQGKLDHPIIRAQLQGIVNEYGKTIRLCRFTFDGEISSITPNQGGK